MYRKKITEVYHHCKVKICKNYADFNVKKVGPGSRLVDWKAWMPVWIRIRQNDAELDPDPQHRLFSTLPDMANATLKGKSVYSPRMLKLPLNKLPFKS